MKKTFIKFLFLYITFSIFPQFQLLAENKTHDELFTIDSHLDTPIRLSFPGFDITNKYDSNLVYSSVDFPRLKEGGLDAGFWAIYSPQSKLSKAEYKISLKNAKKRLSQILSMIKKNSEKFVLAKSVSDIESLRNDSRHIIILSMENAYPLGEDIDMLNYFYEQGLRMLGLVHISNNQFADSSTDKEGERWGGLSPLGIKLVKRANELGIIIDGSHASDKTILQIMKLSKTPIILSHSGVSSVYSHPRNVNDEILLELARTGGVIQMNAYPQYLSDITFTTEKINARKKHFQEMYQAENNDNPMSFKKFSNVLKKIESKYPSKKAKFSEYMSHYDYALDLIGPKHIGVGADWDGGGGVAGMRDVSEIPRITKYLIEKGVSIDDLKQIWSENILRVMRNVELKSKKHIE